MKFYHVVGRAVTAFASLVFVSNALMAQMNNAGPDALNFFLGQWDVELLDQSGAVVGKATTHAYHVLDGTVIQDDWRSLDRAGNVIFRGTSLRTYVPASDAWVVHWVMANTPGYTYIDVRWEGNDLLGDGRGFDAAGEFVERFRYYDIQPNAYSFRLERSYDDGINWQFLNETRARRRAG